MSSESRSAMESWSPLFDIFLNSPTPETDASEWLSLRLHQSSASSSSTTTTTTPITTASFVSLLTQPQDATVLDNSTPIRAKRVMFIQTLPSMVQSRILSFLALEHQRFCNLDLSNLARGVLSSNGEIDFWVKSAAQYLLEKTSDSGYEWVSKLNLDSEEESVSVGFDSVPDWLKNAGSGADTLLPWLPLSADELDKDSAAWVDYCANNNEVLFCDIEENGVQAMDEDLKDSEIPDVSNVELRPETCDKAAELKARIIDYESAHGIVVLADEIRELCLDKKADPLAVLALIEPWRADDEVASLLISHLVQGNENELHWPSYVLCSVILPKLLVLEVAVARLLLTATLEYCKLHQKAAEYALLFPLIMRKEGINSPICEVVTRIIKDCLHPAHVTALCHKLLCGGMEKKGFICLQSHQCMISSELVWTEPLFTLLQSILNHNVHLTQDSIDYLVTSVQNLSKNFSKSLKFGNFLLCFVTKYSSSLKPHKLALTNAVECTDSLLTKSIKSKLSCL